MPALPFGCPCRHIFAPNQRTASVQLYLPPSLVLNRILSRVLQPVKIMCIDHRGLVGLMTHHSLHPANERRQVFDLDFGAGQFKYC